MNGYIECRRGFVGDEQLRAVYDGHGDHHPLAHSAGKLMGIVAGTPVRLRDGHIGHRLHGQLRRFAPGALAMSENRFCDLVADPHHRIQGGHRLLKDHGDSRAAELADGVVCQGREIAAGSVLRK